MPRPPRLELPGVPLHVVQRGNNRTTCFFGDVDRRFYLKCLAQSAGRAGCDIHAYALMTNHVHLLATPRESGAVGAMLQDMGRRYVRVINTLHDRTGTLWEGRFKSSLVDSETYFLTCHRYIELNPVRAGLVAHPAGYPWSSHAHYAGIKVDRLLSEHATFLGLGQNTGARQAAFRALFQHDLDEKTLTQIRQALNAGCGLGSESFLVAMEAKVGRRVRPPKQGRPGKSTQDQEPAPHISGKLF
jgi:putative transposase